MAGEASPLQRFIDSLIATHGAGAHAAIDALCDSAGVLECAAAMYDWRGLLARPSQIIPIDNITHGIMVARRFGKTMANSYHVQEEVEARRVRYMGIMAQNADRTFLDMVASPDVGLIATSPPWNRARFEGDCVVWANGARAMLFTPEAPENLRGPGLDMFWASELQSWPRTTCMAAWQSARTMTSRGYARMIWDGTPRGTSELYRMLRKQHADSPKLHRIVMGRSIWENEANLNPEVIATLKESYGESRAGREELYGETAEVADGVLWQVAWIRQAATPAAFDCKVLGIDPAITHDEGSDPTGIVGCGRTADGKIYMLGDWSDRYAPEQWAAVAIDHYFGERYNRADVEDNRGGEMPLAMLRAEAGRRGLRVCEVNTGRELRHEPGVMNVAQVHARGSKETRAEPVAALYEMGRVFHASSGDLEALENEMLSRTPPHPSRRKALSPNRIDAMVHAVWGLAHLVSGARTAAQQAGEIAVAAKATVAMGVQHAARPSPALAAMLFPRGTRSTI